MSYSLSRHAAARAMGLALIIAGAGALLVAWVASESGTRLRVRGAGTAILGAVVWALTAARARRTRGL